MRYPPPVHKPYQCPVCKQWFTETGAERHYEQTLQAVEAFKKEYSWLKKAIKENTQFVLSTPSVFGSRDRNLTAFKFTRHIKPKQTTEWCASSSSLHQHHWVEADIRIATYRYGSIRSTTFGLPGLTRVDEKVFKLNYELANYERKGKQNVDLWRAHKYAPTIPENFPMTRGEVAAYYKKLTGKKMKGD